MATLTPPSYAQGTRYTTNTSNVTSWTITGSTWMTGTYIAGTGSVTNWFGTPVKKKVKDGKYQVRCRSCARWAKVIREYQNAVFVVDCERCLGEQAGFIA